MYLNLCVGIQWNCLILTNAVNTYKICLMLGKKLSKWHFEIVFLLFFSRKWASTFHANCLGDNLHVIIPGENGTENSVKFHPNFGDIAKYQ